MPLREAVIIAAVTLSTLAVLVAIHVYVLNGGGS